MSLTAERVKACHMLASVSNEIIECLVFTARLIFIVLFCLLVFLFKILGVKDELWDSDQANGGQLNLG